MISPLVNVDVASRSTLTAGGALPVVLMVRCCWAWPPPVSSSGLAVEVWSDDVGLRGTPARTTTGSRSLRQRGAAAVSVIIATYNAGPLLAHALDALAAQSLPAHLIEILVVDDGSTDGTWSYLCELERTRPNIKIFQQPHTEVPAPAAIARSPEATGSFVFFHDADDYLGADALRRLGLAQRADSDIVVASVSWIGKPDAEPGLRRTVSTPTFSMTVSGALSPCTS